MLAHRLRRWTNIKTALCECPEFDGKAHCLVTVKRKVLAALNFGGFRNERLILNNIDGFIPPASNPDLEHSF